MVRDCDGPTAPKKKVGGYPPTIYPAPVNQSG
jgi:hypothetical protein